MRGKYGNVENHIIVANRIRAWLVRHVSHKISVVHSKQTANVFIISWTDGPLVEELADKLQFFLGNHTGRTYVLHGNEYKAIKGFVFKRSYSKERYDILSRYLEERLGTKHILPVQYEIMERDLIRQRLLN